MKFRLLAVATLAVAAGAASAQPPAAGGPRGPGPGGFGLLQFDANADGRLTKAEFDAAQRTRFNTIDANKDGTATAEEFQAARKAEVEARRAEVSKTRFAALDTDKSGQLSQNEFAAAPPRGDGAKGDRHGGRGHRMDIRGGGRPLLAGPDGASKRAGRGDADADRKITFAEFSARGAEAFAQADTNKDGTVTIAELQAMKR